MRIKKFSNIAESLGHVPVLGFSGGKDSQVCYDLLVRSGIAFKAVFNHCFESSETLKFIKEKYPQVEWRREVKEGFFRNMVINHNRILPTVTFSYCCKDYKHNSKYVDYASIVGVRASESQKRRGRKVFESRTKNFLKKNKYIYDYFSESCVASGAPSEISLKPIVDWSDDDVWRYILIHKLPINPEYRNRNRIGCLICPKASLKSNYTSLMKFPKLIDAVIKVRTHERCDWVISSEKKDYSDNKAEYVLRWLNHSFMPFSKKDLILKDEILKNYSQMK